MFEQYNYYLDPNTNEVHIFSKDVDEDTIKQMSPNLLTWDGKLQLLSEQEAKEQYDIGQKQILESLIRTIRQDIYNGFYDYVYYWNCECNRFKYRGSDRGGYVTDSDITTKPDALEQETWEQQYKEAYAYKQTNFTDRSVCPNLVVLASTRGRDLDDTVNKILNKKSEYDRKLFRALGLKQKYNDIIEENINDFQKIQELHDTRKEWILF